ncbi:hypothetical protein MRB53_002819 [Persea americana]|uniref:Uncharacterized protein n=1 Tax=Persea americana TaxID=3435 RepID=A0ACC2MVJ5_PERAE|nr:hypothetical protein MRB53_002819 [Persea americana]
MARSAFACFAVVLVMLMIMEGWRSEAAISCDQAVAALTPCINNARIGGTVTPECCNGIRQVAAELKASPDLQGMFGKGRLYAMKCRLKIPAKDQIKMTRELIVSLMNQLEKVDRSIVKPDEVTFVGCFGLHKDVELAERVVSTKARDSGDKVLLSNLHASIGRWGNVEKLGKIIKGQGIQNILGCSLIVIENDIHEFISGDKSHPRYAENNDKLEELGEDGCCWIFGKMDK